MKNIETTRKHRGYESRQEPTNIDALNESVLIPPSANVFVTNQGLVQSRGGLEKFGTASGSVVESTFDWETNRSQYHSLRTTDNTLQVFYEGDWVEILTGKNRDRTSFAVWWDNEAKLDTLLFVDGENLVYTWSGAIGTVASISGDEIFLELDSVAIDATELGFRVGDIINVDGNTYTIDSFGGDGQIVATTSVTGSAGDIVFTSVLSENTFDFSFISPSGTKTDVAAGDVADTFGFYFDVVAVVDNNAIFGSNSSQRVLYSSKVDWADFTFSEPRLVGEGDTFVLDAPVTAITVDPLNNLIVISCGRDKVFSVKEERIQTTDNTAFLAIRRYMSGYGAGILNQHAHVNIKNTVAFLNFQNELDTIGRLENVDSPQGKPISWKIANDMRAYDLTGAQTSFFENNLGISVPVHSKVLIYDLEQQIWQPPMDIDGSAWSVINGRWVIHDSNGQAHYIFSGTSDNGAPIQQKAVFDYRSYGSRYNKKRWTIAAAEGYLSSGAEITYKRNFDYAAQRGTFNHVISLKDTDTKFYGNVGSFGIGRYAFGTARLGSSAEDGGFTFDVEMQKFRTIKHTDPVDFYEDQVSFELNTLDAVMAIISWGANTALSANNSHLPETNPTPETDEFTPS